MLTTEFEIDHEGMTVPYAPLFDDARRNQGFLDLRGRPDLAAMIVEGSISMALRELLVALSRPGSMFFTIGCDLGQHEEPWRDADQRQVAGGYVQVMCAAYADQSPEHYAAIGSKIANALENKAQNHDWDLRFILKPVILNLDDFDGLTGSLDVCFFAMARTASEADASRELLITGLADALTDPLMISKVDNHLADDRK